MYRYRYHAAVDTIQQNYIFCSAFFLHFVCNFVDIINKLVSSQLNQVSAINKMTTSEKIQKLWEAYTEAWSEISAEKRAELTIFCLDENVLASNPQIDVGCRKDLVLDMSHFQVTFPGSHFELEPAIIHHDQLLGAWTLIAKDGSEILKGYNYFRVGGTEDKIVHMTGFF